MTHRSGSRIDDIHQHAIDKCCDTLYTELITHMQRGRKCTFTIFSGILHIRLQYHIYIRLRNKNRILKWLYMQRIWKRKWQWRVTYKYCFFFLTWFKSHDTGMSLLVDTKRSRPDSLRKYVLWSPPNKLSDIYSNDGKGIIHTFVFLCIPNTLDQERVIPSQ